MYSFRTHSRQRSSSHVDEVTSQTLYEALATSPQEENKPYVDDPNSHSVPFRQTDSDSDFDAALLEKYTASKSWLSAHFLKFPLQLLQSCAPSFVRRPGAMGSPPKAIRPTAWLDGLRGVAALTVVIHHSSLVWYFHWLRGWQNSTDGWIRLPIFRLFVSGSGPVAIFFVVSGYSLSYKTLGLIRKGRFPEIHDTLSSAVLRRGLRLTIPPAIVTFFGMIATYLGWYAANSPPNPDTFLEHLQSWFRSVIELFDPFRPRVYPGGYNPPYNGALWTIPVEFHGSMVIYTVLMGISKVREPFRVAILGAMVIFCFLNVYTHLFLFLSGVLIAELHYLREEHFSNWTTQLSESPPLGEQGPFTTTTQTHRPIIFKTICIAIFTLSLYVMSMPLISWGGGDTPGFRTLGSMIPALYASQYICDHFWKYLAAVTCVFILDNAQFLQCIFTTSIAQYLGRLSFALYICHSFFLSTIGVRMTPHMVALMGGNDHGWRYHCAVGMIVLVMYPLMFITSDLVARHVDEKISVGWVRRMASKISVSS